ncbi:MAG TPA: LON peptidase substrate-binding domain-containing protein [Gemmatimonadales bacterium]|nr:LON peptidase substrate-binding domain-containing protein [Gemmatimonadales bacterium]
MPARLPLFPLEVVLFPGTPLPLHIFEPRYRAMLADCLRTDERFGLLPPSRDGSPPRAGTVGCIARIRASHQLPDGRSNIVVVGERRFLLRQTLAAETPYLVGVVDAFDDLAGAAVPDESLAALREVATTYVGAMDILGGGADRAPWADDAESLSFQVAAAVDFEFDVKRRLLESRTAAERIALLLELLPPLAAEAAGRARVHSRARNNGEGGPHPDIAVAQ